jgi:hypothetical protein
LDKAYVAAAISGLSSIIVLAPSAAGKSTLVANIGSPLVVDGDDLIGMYNGWRGDGDKGWDEYPKSMRDRFRQFHCEVLEAYSAYIPMLLWNGDPKYFSEAAMKKVLVWNPNYEDHLLNMRRRAQHTQRSYGISRIQIVENTHTLLGLGVKRARPVLSTDEVWWLARDISSGRLAYSFRGIPILEELKARRVLLPGPVTHSREVR